MAILGVDDFKSKIAGGGARPNLFQVTLNFPAYAGGNTEISSFLVRAASLPASNIPEMIVPIRGRQLKIAGDRVFEPWATTILNDTDFLLRNAVERWMNGMNAHQLNTGLVNPVDYQADLKVFQLDRDDNVLKVYIFRNAWPVNVASIELSTETTNAIEEFECTWRYQHFEASEVTSGISAVAG